MRFALGHYDFVPRLFPTVMSLFFVAVFISLGHWQSQRADYKEGLRQQFQQGEQATPLAVDSATQLGKDINSYPIKLAGHFEPRYSVLLDNQVEQGRAGFQLLTLFITNQNNAVFIERGWLPLGLDRQHLTPVPPVMEQPLLVRGKIYFPSDKQFVLKADDYHHVSWPLLVQDIELKKLAAVLQAEMPGVKLAPFLVRLDEDVMVEYGPQLPRHWQFMVMGPEKSRAYAYQWFAMAVVLLGFYLYFSLEPKSREPTST